MRNFLAIDGISYDITDIIEEYKIQVGIDKLFCISEKPCSNIFWGGSSAIFRYQENKIFIHPKEFHRPERRDNCYYTIFHELTHWLHYNRYGISKHDDFVLEINSKYGYQDSNNIITILEVMADYYLFNFKEKKYSQYVSDFINCMINRGSTTDSDMIIHYRISGNNSILTPEQEDLMVIIQQIEQKFN